IGDDGCGSLSSRAAGALARAQILVGGERQLAFFPDFAGPRIPLRGDLQAALAQVADLAREQTVCVLSSGDPLFFGIGARIVSAVGSEHVEFIPAPSSVQWAFARTGISWEDALVLSVHGRSAEGFVARVRSAAKVAVLTDADNNPAALAARLIEFGEFGFEAWVCERLAGPAERVRRFTLEELANTRDLDPLNVLLLSRTDPDWRAPCSVPGLPEEAFAKRIPKQGLITKREVRVLSLSALQLRPDSVLWDVGAGSGSVAIESALLAPKGRVYAIEVDPECVAMCRENARAHGADNVRVIAGLAPEACHGLERPDCVFVGGSKGSLTSIIALALDVLRPGGRLVVNAITLENIGEAYAALRERQYEPEVTLVQIARGVPLARYLRYESLNPIHIFAVRKGDNVSRAGASEPGTREAEQSPAPAPLPNASEAGGPT
ncbi:MAG TPA: precorrin-6y C5,15-methyltransferase (decarboxylating) subunit CbiE, partial [Polyangiaceae bacterium]|nr:precorrin-6y C5,15-methyltransferase (decarboxylating) subunit CbiE [Polyangiaceae bacterium]